MKKHLQSIIGLGIATALVLFIAYLPTLKMLNLSTNLMSCARQIKHEFKIEKVSVVKLKKAIGEIEYRIVIVAASSRSKVQIENLLQKVAIFVRKKLPKPWNKIKIFYRKRTGSGCFSRTQIYTKKVSWLRK